MEIIGDPEGLVREIREKARRESEGIVEAAEAEAVKLLASAAAAATRARRETMAAALEEAERRREMLLASVPGEAARLRADKREALLEAVKAEALRLLPAGADKAGRGGVLAALAAQALEKMEGNKFIITLSPSDRAAAAGLGAELERRAGRGPLELTVEEDPGLNGGVVVRDAEGRLRWDNSFRGRLERFWPELRGLLLGEDK